MSVLSLLPEDKRKDQRNSLESVYSSNSRLNLLHKRKRMSPLRLALGMSSQTQQRGDRSVTQRVLSAKTHRIKQLQNQLADAHYHLQELSNENKILRALQKKQETALQRYESSSAELPQVLAAHSEETRVQQIKYRQARQQLRDLEARLREREQQLQALRDEHRHLLQLTRDKNLLEREKLQVRVSELNETVRQQQETISALQRRIALEAKNFKHRLQVEVNKHKDTRHDLDLAISNADKLSTIIEMKEKMISTAASRTGGSRSPSKTATGSRSQSRTAGFDDASKSSAMSQRCTYTAVNERPTAAGARVADPSELARAVRDGIADLTIDDDRLTECATPEDTRIRMRAMKMDLMTKIINNEESTSRRASALRGRSSEESTEEELTRGPTRPVSRGRRSSAVCFSEADEDAPGSTDLAAGDDVDRASARKLSGKQEKYCKNILEDIEKSSRVIDVHVRQLSAVQSAGDRIAEQLRAVDRVNELVNAKGDVPEPALTRLQERFQSLSEHVVARGPSGRRAKVSTLLDDEALTNRDLLDDLLGKK
ncbi:unnamed protein product [Leptosia nina]|uniref:Lebercilin domain-containing protein n=1 Tax=Leptosia nina TaxID=320188 RepID=A0AAV1JXC2_9NEOP